MKGKFIFDILSNDFFTKQIFDGFWFPDLPTTPIRKDPALIIVNTDESTGPGEHWCAIFIDQNKNICEYFDPLGQPPINKLYEYSFLPHLNKYSLSVDFNSVPVQSPTANTCGHHCIYFSCLKAQNYSFKFIIDGMYSRNTQRNDAKVLKFVRKKTLQHDPAYLRIQAPNNNVCNRANSSWKNTFCNRITKRKRNII
jgi:hypothetical protein